jgi:hypothetical protein
MAEQVVNWRKSSASANGEACVEVGNSADTIAIRDTTDRGGSTLSVPATAWTAFLATLR